MDEIRVLIWLTRWVNGKPGHRNNSMEDPMCRGRIISIALAGFMMLTLLAGFMVLAHSVRDAAAQAKNITMELLARQPGTVYTLTK